MAATILVIATLAPEFMSENDPISIVAGQLDLRLNDQDFDRCRSQIAKAINELIEKDFPRLIMILYRVDVSEIKLKKLLQQNPGTDAGLLIADMMIERQSQKTRSREQFTRPKNEDGDNEEW